MYSVSLDKLVIEFNLEPLVDVDISKIVLTKSEANRPALQLAGFFDYFSNDRIQIIGNVEQAYLMRLQPDYRENVLKKIFQYKIPCFIICRGLEPFQEMLVFAKESGIPVYRTPKSTSDFIGEVMRWLKHELAERITIHGVLVDIYGEGILITGDSGVGKSETALELIKRGHRLVADDAVEIKKVSHSTLLGNSPDLIRHFIELRGIGIIDIKEVFGIGSVKESQKIDLVINLEIWDDEKAYDRLGLMEEHATILGNTIPKNNIPIRPGRNLAVICEAAANNNRLKRLGYNAAQVLTERLKAGNT